MRILYWLIALPLAAILVSFTISNRADVVLQLWPLPFEMGVPLAFVGFAALFLGFIAGGGIVWVNGQKTRSRASRAERKLNSQAREMAVMRDQLRRAEEAGGKTALPANADSAKSLPAA